MRKQTGFTLIELIIVIIILGILAAYAVPKYMTIDSQARASVVQGLAGSVRAAADMVHSIAVAQGVSGNVSIGSGANITLATNLYPDNSEAGIAAALSDYSGFTFSGGKFTKNGAGNSCYVEYNPANTPPTVTVATDKC